MGKPFSFCFKRDNLSLESLEAADDAVYKLFKMLKNKLLPI